MAVVQKKISMLGAFATGKTSLVRQFVHSVFSEKYHTTVGVKIDRKTVKLDDTTVNMLLWDIEGRGEGQEFPQSYLRGSAGLIYVVDGTRLDSFRHIVELHKLAQSVVGDVPSVVALNKCDLQSEWEIGQGEVESLQQEGWQAMLTSAKTGQGVENAFHWLAASMIRG